jgi:hypothetical protein
MSAPSVEKIVWFEAPASFGEGQLYMLPEGPSDLFRDESNLGNRVIDE